LIVFQDLCGAKFDGADLRRARFIQTVFNDRTSFRGADLRGGELVDVKLKGVDFEGALINQLLVDQATLRADQIKATESYRRRDLSGCKLEASVQDEWDGQNRGWTGVQDLSLAGFDLVETSFVGIDLTKMDLSDTDLARTRFRGCQVRQDQIFKSRGFSYPSEPTDRQSPPVQYAGMRFENMDLRGWSFVKANLRHASFVGCQLDGADFSGAEIEGAQLGQITADQLASTANFRRGELIGVTLRTIDLRDRDFSRMNLTGVHFLDCKVQGVDLTDAVVTNANFCSHAGRPDDKFSLDQIRSTWNARNGRLDGVCLPLSAVHLSGSSTSAPK
jgi:uncharacterized protein YjbI with pentapeptide repeats